MTTQVLNNEFVANNECKILTQLLAFQTILTSVSLGLSGNMDILYYSALAVLILIFFNGLAKYFTTPTVVEDIIDAVDTAAINTIIEKDDDADSNIDPAVAPGALLELSELQIVNSIYLRDLQDLVVIYSGADGFVSDSPNLDLLTAKELKKLGSKFHIKNYSRMRKAELISALKEVM